jgi:NADH-quinone oxidoreductase subunit C
MSAKLDLLSSNLQKHIGDRIALRQVALGEVTIDVAASDYLGVMAALRDEPELRFEELMDFVRYRLPHVQGRELGRKALCGR